MPTADIDGLQRKIVRTDVRPLRPNHGESGIPLRSGRTLPFVVSRGWNAPSGYYNEAWYLVHPETREVLFEGASDIRLIRGLPTVTDFTDEVREPFALQPGSYKIVFALDGVKGAEIDIHATEVPAEEAA
jgi:hypothetical protein